LPGPNAARYQRIVPQLGRYPSAVLGLDLAVSGGKLRFFDGMAELFGTAGLIGRLQGMLEDLETRADEAQAQAGRAQAQAEQAQAEAGRAQAQAEHAQAEAGRAQAQAEQAMTGLRDAILALLGARQIPCPDEARARLQSCDDPATLQRWLLRATTAGSSDEVFVA
jgi:hypothetical protein